MYGEVVRYRTYGTYLRYLRYGTVGTCPYYAIGFALPLVQLSCQHHVGYGGNLSAKLELSIF